MEFEIMEDSFEIIKVQSGYDLRFLIRLKGYAGLGGVMAMPFITLETCECVMGKLEEMRRKNDEDRENDQ